GEDIRAEISTGADDDSAILGICNSKQGNSAWSLCAPSSIQRLISSISDEESGGESCGIRCRGPRLPSINSMMLLMSERPGTISSPIFPPAIRAENCVTRKLELELKIPWHPVKQTASRGAI